MTDGGTSVRDRVLAAVDGRRRIDVVARVANTTETYARKVVTMARVRARVPGMREECQVRAGPWADEVTEYLRSLLKQSMSSSLMAEAINRKFRMALTRNAIIGKVHRLGLQSPYPAHPRISKNPPRPKRPRIMRKPSRVVVALASLPLPDQPASDEARKTFKELADHHCRYPVGDPQDADFGYCGLNRVPGLHYCLEHVRRCYKVLEPQGRQLERVKPRQVVPC